MYDIRWIKNNITLFDKAMEKRGIPSISNEAIKLYEEHVNLISKLHKGSSRTSKLGS